MRNTLKSTILAAGIAAGAMGAMGTGLVSSANATDYLKMEGNPIGTAAGQMQVAFSQLIQKRLDVKIQVSVGKAAPKAALDVAKQKSDLFLVQPTINFFMQKKMAMFAKVDKAPELNANLRGIFNFSLGPFHMVTYEGSGVETLADMAGKKVFLGPPAGAATKVVMQVVGAATGMKPGEDYELMRFDWKSASTAFVDRQMDVFTVPTTVPSPMIHQFSLVNKVRFLGVSDAVWESKAMKKIMMLPGITEQTIPANVYENQVNTAPVRTFGAWGGIGTNKFLDEELVYQMTKIFWENLDEVHATAEWMKTVDKEHAFAEMNVPLHAGAYRFYKEAGWEIPSRLVPPEAK